MKFPIGAMTVGDILDRGLKVLLPRLPAFYVINLIVLAPLIVFQLAAPTFLAGVQNPSDPMAQLGPTLLVFFLTLILTIILQPIGTAAILHIIAQDFVDKRVSLGDALNFGLRRFGSLFVTSLLVGLVLVVGFILLIVPGIIFYVWYAFFAQVVVVEGLSGTAAMERSKALTEGYRWRIFGVIILVGIIGAVIGFAVGLLNFVIPSYEQLVVPKTGPFDSGIRLVPIYPNFYINTLLGILVQILVATYQTICITLLYFDLRNRKEGFDLEMAAREQQAAPQPSN